MAENQVAKAGVKDFLKSEAVQKSIKETLGNKSTQFTTSLLSLVGNDALLAEAQPQSLFTAALTAASLDLPINKNLGFAHIIGYRNGKKGIVEAQFQIGAKGLKQLAMRTGQYKFINNTDVRKGELISFDRLSGEIQFEWEQDTAKREKLPIIGYVSYFRLHNGFESTVYMTVEEVTAHAKRYSQSYKSGFGPWKDNFEAMALKTVTKKNISNNGPMSTELEKAVTFDQAVTHEDGTVDYIDGEEADPVIHEDLAEAINGAQSTDELKAVVEDLDTNTRKAAVPYINKRMSELEKANAKSDEK